MNNTFYLAILHDRHTDDKFVVCDTPEEAIEQCKAWIEKYPKDRYHFEEKDYGYIFYADAGESYSIRAEQVERITKRGRKKNNEKINSTG